MPLDPDPFRQPTSLVIVRKAADFRLGKDERHDSFTLWRGNTLFACGGRPMLERLIEKHGGG